MDLSGLKRNWRIYLTILLGIIFLFLNTVVFAASNPHARYEIRAILCNKALVFENCTTRFQKIAFHKENGDRCFAEAKNICFYLPRMSDRRLTECAFGSAVVLLSNATPASKIVAAVVLALSQYGVDSIGEWREINNKLYWAQYHYEMMEFHQACYNNGHY